MTLEADGRQLNGTSQSYGDSKVSKPEQSLNGTVRSASTLLSEFLKSHRELQSYRYGFSFGISYGVCG